MTVYNLQFKSRHQLKKWPSTTEFKVGNWALRSIHEATGFISMDSVRKGRKTFKVARFSREFMGLKDSIMTRALEPLIAFGYAPPARQLDRWVSTAVTSPPRSGTCATDQTCSDFGPALKQEQYPRSSRTISSPKPTDRIPGFLR